MMPSAECAAGIDDEGRAARRRLGGVVRGLTKKRPAMTGSRPAWLIVTQSSSPSGSRLCAPSALSAPIRATATASGFALKIGFGSHSSGRLSSGSRVIPGRRRIEAERLNIKLANRLRLVAGAGQGQFPAGHDLAVFSFASPGVEALVPGLGSSGALAGGGGGSAPDSRSNTPLPPDAASAGNRIQVPRSGQKVERNTAIKGG